MGTAAQFEPEKLICAILFTEQKQADEALSALGQQLAFTVPQGQYPGEYWSLAEALGDDIIGGKYNDADDAALLAALQTFQDTCIGYAG